MAKSKQTKKSEEVYSSSLFKQTDKRKKSRYTLKGAAKNLNTKVDFGGGIGNDAKFSKGSPLGLRRQRFQEKLNETNFKSIEINEAGNTFLESEKTLTLKIRQPKKNASAKQQKIAIAHEKNEKDGIMFERAELNLLWEQYTKQKKQISFRLFESKMKQSKFKQDVLALKDTK